VISANVVAWRYILTLLILTASLHSLRMSIMQWLLLRCNFGSHVPSIFTLLFVLHRNSLMDLNHLPSRCCIGLVSSRTGLHIPAIIWTQSSLIHIVLPNGENSRECCRSAVIWAIDFSAYRFFSRFRHALLVHILLLWRWFG
jgi:hypothetical protein